MVNSMLCAMVWIITCETLISIVNHISIFKADDLDSTEPMHNVNDL